MKQGNFDEMMTELNNGTYDFTDNGKCIQCGNCCSNFLPMTYDEIKNIHEYVRKKKIKRCKHGLFAREKVIDFVCPFLDESKDKEKCRIYEVRPAVCREFTCCQKDRKEFASRKKIVVVNVRNEFFGGDN